MNSYAVAWSFTVAFLFLINASIYLVTKGTPNPMMPAQIARIAAITTFQKIIFLRKMYKNLFF